MVPKHKGKQVSCMVWGCFWGNQRGTFCPIIVGKINSQIYIKLLEYLLPPVLDHVRTTVLCSPSHQQDNATIHKSPAVTTWFKANNINVQPHPTYSPDVNPIEHVWVAFKCRLTRKYPNLPNTQGGPKKVKGTIASTHSCSLPTPAPLHPSLPLRTSLLSHT